MPVIQICLHFLFLFVRCLWGEIVYTFNSTVRCRKLAIQPTRITSKKTKANDNVMKVKQHIETASSLHENNIRAKHQYMAHNKQTTSQIMLLKVVQIMIICQIKDLSSADSILLRTRCASGKSKMVLYVFPCTTNIVINKLCTNKRKVKMCLFHSTYLVAATTISPFETHFLYIVWNTSFL